MNTEMPTFICMLFVYTTKRSSDIDLAIISSRMCVLSCSQGPFAFFVHYKVLPSTCWHCKWLHAIHRTSYSRNTSHTSPYTSRGTGSRCGHDTNGWRHNDVTAAWIIDSPMTNKAVYCSSRGGCCPRDVSWVRQDTSCNYNRCCLDSQTVANNATAVVAHCTAPLLWINSEHSFAVKITFLAECRRILYVAYCFQ